MRVLLTSFIILTIASFFLACGGQQQSQTQEQKAVQTSEQQAQSPEVVLADSMAIDPVCGMKVNKEETAYTAEFEGKTYYFCMEQDRMTFLENPQEYLPKEKD